MEGASATRLRFKGSSSSSSSRKRKSESGSSNIYSPSESSYHHKHRRRASSRSYSRSRSRSPRHSSHHHHKHHSSKHHSRKHLRHRDTPSPPQRTAPATYSDYFDNDAHEANESRFREEQAQPLDEQEQDPWLAHVFDELSNDDPLEYHSSRFESMYQHANRGTGSGGHASKYDHLNSLSDDRYADYMRQGMSGRSSHRSSAGQKEDKEWAEWVQDQERIKYRQERDKRREKDERARQRRQERRDKEKEDGTRTDSMDSATNVLRKKGAVDKARKDYAQGWSALMDGKVPVSEDTIPWPPSITSGSSTPTTTTEPVGVLLYEFLFLGTPAEKIDIRRQLLRREQLKFHPDKFKQRFGTRLPMNATIRQAILDRVERVAQELNEIGELL